MLDVRIGSQATQRLVDGIGYEDGFLVHAIARKESRDAIRIGKRPAEPGTQGVPVDLEADGSDGLTLRFGQGPLQA